MLYLAWRYGGEDPYRLFHMLDADYTPFGGGEPRRPAYPLRVKAFILACAELAEEEAIKLAGGKVSRRRDGKKG